MIITAQGHNVEETNESMEQSFSRQYTWENVVFSGW